MHFGETLKRSAYAPWRARYIDYDKLKALLRQSESGKDGEGEAWTEEDENKFVTELDSELEKVNAFHAEIYDQLRERTSQCEKELEKAAEAKASKNSGDASGTPPDFSKVLAQLDSISKEVSELERFKRLNFTAALKITKKRDKTVRIFDPCLPTTTN